APSYEMGEKDIAVDAHFTASAMAKDNFNSSENMKNKQVKKLHSSMALQQATIAEAYEDLMNKMGWMNQPDASITDRKSTRLNSSHVSISYAVFCLKKKN